MSAKSQTVTASYGFPVAKTSACPLATSVALSPRSVASRLCEQGNLCVRTWTWTKMTFDPERQTVRFCKDESTFMPQDHGEVHCASYFIGGDQSL